MASGQEVLEQLGPGLSFSGSLPHSTSRELLVPQSDSVTARPEALETIIWPSTLHCCRASGGWPAGGHESKVRDVGVGLPAARQRLEQRRERDELVRLRDGQALVDALRDASRDQSPRCS